MELKVLIQLNGSVYTSDYILIPLFMRGWKWRW